MNGRENIDLELFSKSVERTRKSIQRTTLLMRIATYVIAIAAGVQLGLLIVMVRELLL